MSIGIHQTFTPIILKLKSVIVVKSDNKTHK
jgi:hypothetical protein